MRVRDIVAEHKQGYYRPGKFDLGDVGYARISDLTDDGFLDETTMPRINVESEVVNAFGIRKNDFLFARTGGAGRFGLVTKDVHGIFASYLIRFRFKENYDPKFLRYFFFSQSFQLELTSKIHGGVNQNVHAENIKDCSVPVFPLDEQKRIVAILDEAFAAIDKAKQNAEKNLQNARELFESYLQNIFANPGDDWESKSLGDIGKVSMCKRVFKEQTTTIGDVPFFKIGTFGKTPDAFISSKIYDEFREKYSFPRIGDVLLSASGTIGRRVKYDGEPAYFQDSNIVWLAHDEQEILNDYLYYFYGSYEWKPTRGATISRLYNDDLRQMKIAFPKDNLEQRKIVDVLDLLTGQIESLEAVYKRKSSALVELKKSILQKAFSGELSN